VPTITHWVTTASFMGFLPIPRPRIFLGTSREWLGIYQLARLSQQIPYVDRSYVWPGFSTQKTAASSSAYTCLKKSQFMQLSCFWAKVPCCFPPQNVPATAQQILPPFLPPFKPSEDSSVDAGQTPSSATLSPPTCLPHFLYSQQLLLSPILDTLLFLTPIGNAHIKQLTVKNYCSEPQDLLDLSSYNFFRFS